MKNALLFFAGFLPTLLLFVLGFWNPFRGKTVCALLRSQIADCVLFLPAAAIFIHRAAMLSEADFGMHRSLLTTLFSVLAVFVLWKNNGFLSVRGITILQLLWANMLLGALRGNFSQIWLVAKAIAYGIVLLACWLTIQPYRLRDWLLRRAQA
jgi:hypothetical protein